MAEELTRASGSTTQKRKTTSTTSSQRRKTTSTSTQKRKTTSSAKKPSTSAKKPSTTSKSSSTSIRLTKEEKTLVTNFRKCNILEKKVITMLASKFSDGTTRTPEENTQLDGLVRMLGGDQ